MNKIKLYIVRWSWSREEEKWFLQPCYPCSDCAKYLEKHKKTILQKYFWPNSKK